METVRSKIANRAATVQKPAAALKGVQRKAVAGKSSVRLQTSMKVSSPKDPAEKEADATAKKIMRMAVPESSIDYVRNGGEGVFRQVKKEEKEQKVQAKLQSPYITHFANTGIFTQPKKKEEEKIQRKAEGQPNVTSDLAADIQSSMAAGAPLPPSVRRFMEPRFQANFSNVKIQTGDKAAKLNRQLNARAFTVGNQIFFGKDKFQPDSQEGKELIAHELTHTIQQGAAIQRSEDVTVTQQSPVQIQRLGLSDILDGLADLAANVPGFTLLTVIIGRNPINLRIVERNFTNLLRGFMGLIPGGEILFQVLQNYRVVERIGIWVDQQMRAMGISYDDLRRRFTTFTDSLSWSDIFSPGDVWQRAQNIFTEPIARIRNFISQLIDRAIAWLKETFMEPLSNFCREIPGYTLVTVLLGRDPFTNAPVDRSPLNLVRAFAEFIPGGTEKVNQLVESRGLQQAYEWFIQETQARNLTWARVTGTFSQAWNSLRLEDVLHPIDTLQRLVTMFRPLMSDLVSFAGAALMKLLELIFEAVMGAGGARILAILKRGRDTFLTIIRNPVGFLGNLLRAVGQGVRQFMNNILQHLQQGVIAWLTGPVARAGIQMPERWDLRGIIGFVMQILGLTWDRIRQKLVRLMGERAVATLEAGFQLIQEIRERGLVQALRDRVTEFFGQLREAALGSIKSFIQQRLVMAGIQQLVSLLSPVGAVIQAIIKTYTTIQFFIQKINQILDLVESIVNSTAAIAAGAIGAAAGFIERTMARTIPVILDFLARFIGLGDVGGQVQSTIRGLQARVDGMLDRAVDWIRSMAQRLGTAVVQAGVPQDPNERLRLGLDAATAAVNALAGTSVTSALINPVLTAIRIRYGFRILQAVEVAQEWWIEGVVNPPGRRKTRKRSGTANEPEQSIQVGQQIQLRSTTGGWSIHPYRVTQVTATTLSYEFAGTERPASAAMRGLSSLSARGTSWRLFVAASVPLPEEEILTHNGGLTGTNSSWADFTIAKRVLNYRHHIHQFNPPNKDWEHIVEQSSGVGANSVDNLALADRRLNQVDLNQWFGSRQESSSGFPSTGPRTVREYLVFIGASPQERSRWKRRAYLIFRVQVRSANQGRGSYQILD